VNHHVSQLLQESLTRRWVQYGKVIAVQPVTLKGTREKQELIVISFQGERVYCPKEDFVNRPVTSFNGFIHTEVPFIVKSIEEELDIVRVSRVEAIPRVAQAFLNRVKEGEVVTGTVTGVLDNNCVFLDVDGFPCMIPPTQWDLRKINKLRELLPLGTEVHAKVLNIEKYDGSKKTHTETDGTGKSVKSSANTDEMGDEEERTNSAEEFGYRVTLSRRAMREVERENFWLEIEKHHNVGDRTAVTVAGIAPGENSYYCELPSGITLIGNLNATLRKKYSGKLPPGIKCHAEIKRIDKNTKRGKVLIFRVEPNYAALMNHAFGAL